MPRIITALLLLFFISKAQSQSLDTAGAYIFKSSQKMKLSKQIEMGALGVSFATIGVSALTTNNTDKTNIAIAGGIAALLLTATSITYYFDAINYLQKGASYMYPPAKKYIKPTSFAPSIDGIGVVYKF